jgi:hypothetical protein
MVGAEGGAMGVPGDDERTRPSSGLLRVPFVRRCTLEFGDGRAGSGFVVNINVLGAYVTQHRVGAPPDAGGASPALPRLGEGVSCRFQVPGRPREVHVQGAVTWVNVQQQHPVHSLPPGFGIRFEGLSDDDRASIEGLVAEYLERQTPR